VRRVQTFFYVCGGILALAISFHLGAGNAQGQAPGNPLVAVSDTYAYTANGDVYQATSGRATWVLIGNVFSGGPIPAERTTLGSIKAKYR
jgi:hypothetical protein